MRHPKYFSDDQKTKWDETIEELGDVDLETLEAYITEWKRWKDAESWMRDNGDVITVRNEKGIVKTLIKAPQLLIAREAALILIKLKKEMLYGRRR